VVRLNCPAYDTEMMTWRHLNFFQHEAYLHARVPRVNCSACGIKRVTVPWAREVQNPIYSGRVFRGEVGQAYRFDVGHRSEMKPATLAG
jgi:hypothetical protein